MKDETNRDKGQGGKGPGENAKPQAYPSSLPGFTLIELLTVLIIITILVGILLPTISHIRRSAYNTGVQAQMATLRQAIDQYYADFHAYPGPVANTVMGTTSAADAINFDPLYTSVPLPTGWTATSNLITQMTGTENLVLGLIGGLKQVPTGTSGTIPAAYYNPTLVGQGAISLNAGLPKKFGTYIDTADLEPAFNNPATQNGLYSEPGVPVINDTPIPEILDRFPSRMPILYLRANVGATMYVGASQPGNLSDYQNPIVINAADSQYGTNTGSQTSPTSSATAAIIRYAQYDISQIIAYTQSYSGVSIGEGKTAVQNVGSGTGPYTHGLQTVGFGTSNSAPVLSSNDASGTYYYPYPAYAYFKDPNSPAYAQGPPVVLPYARAKDTYILISAGIDRIYGTADDITSFGDVRP